MNLERRGWFGSLLAALLTPLFRLLYPAKSFQYPKDAYIGDVGEVQWLRKELERQMDYCTDLQNRYDSLEARYWAVMGRIPKGWKRVSRQVCEHIDKVGITSITVIERHY